MNPVFRSSHQSNLIPPAQGRPAEDPIFAIHAEAVSRASKGESVIDASLGTLLGDDGQVAVMPTVFEAFRDVDPRQAAAYAPIAGDAHFRAAVISDVFGSSELAERSACVATAGGTGAIFAAVVNFVEQGHAFYTTDFHWGPYRTIADHTRRKVRTFRMFKEGRFDVEAFEAGLVALGEEQGSALVLLNFPCQNPTGYSLNDEEWVQVTAVLSRALDRFPVTLLMDVAYAEYAPAGASNWIRHFEDLVPRMPLLVAWSASKTYAQYGARVGALVAAVHDQDERERVQNAMTYSCRGTWSNCNHRGLLAVAQLLEDPVRAKAVDGERAKLIASLGERVEVFNLEAASAGLIYPRYEAGFFVTVFTDHPEAAAERCRADGVFVVPIQGALRVGLCATPKSRVPRLVQALARGIAAES